MDYNEIKKLLYKEKPVANRHSSTVDFDYYATNVTGHFVVFAVPSSEAKNFNKQEPAQLLIRWLDDIVPNQTT